MSGSDIHERWETLIDREALGEVLDPEQRAFVASYEADHPELAHERVVFTEAIASMREQLELDASELDELGLARAAAAALERYRSEPAPESEPVPGNRRSLRVHPSWWVVGLAAAAGVALWFTVRPAHDDAAELRVDRAGSAIEDSTRPENPTKRAFEPVDARPSPGAPVDPIARLSMVSGPTPAVELGAELGLGESSVELLGATANERACVTWSAPTAVVCFEGSLRSVPGLEVGERRVRLDSGRLVAALDPLGPGQRFTVETMLGTVSAIGTVFAVEIHEGQQWLTVLEGRVELRDPVVRSLTAGQRTSLRGEIPSDEPTPMVADAIPSALTELVDLAELLRASPGLASVEIPAVAGDRLTLDDRRLDGPAILSLAAGAHTLRLVDDDGQGSPRLDETVVLEDGHSLDLAELLASAATPPKPSARKSSTAKQLAEAAQASRTARDYPETARLYRELLSRFPDSPEATNVPVRLGDLLAATGDHAGALTAYELYLESSATQLVPEAEYGRIQALRALARESQERAAIVAFLEARPDDYRSTELRTRLTALAE